MESGKQPKSKREIRDQLAADTGDSRTDPDWDADRSGIIKGLEEDVDVADDEAAEEAERLEAARKAQEEQARRDAQKVFDERYGDDE